MGKILAITNQKGGVGKSTICFNFATFLSEKYKKKVLVVDLDTQGNISHTLIKGTIDGRLCDVMHYYGLQTKDLFRADIDLKITSPMQATHGLSLIYTEPNDLSLSKSVYQEDASGDVSGAQGFKNFVQNIKLASQDFDLTLIDCPPFIGEHVLPAILSCDYVITPVQPTSFVIDGTKSFFDNLKRCNKTDAFLGMVLNNVDKNWLRHKAMVEQLKETMGDKIYATTLYHRGPYDNAVYLNESLFSRHSWRKAADEFDRFLIETVERINKLDNNAFTL